MRRAQVDLADQPVRNLWRVPGFELPNGAFVYRTNLASNPAMESQGALTVMRQNLATDPLATKYTGTTGLGFRNSRWFGQNTPAGTYTLVTGAVDGPIPEITTYARKTWTSNNMGASNGDTGFELSSGTGTGAYKGAWNVTA